MTTVKMIDGEEYVTKTHHIETVEAVRAEYLGQCLALHAFRCACQIAGKPDPECAARGWCKDRKP
jgi:hypothetical protein